MKSAAKLAPTDLENQAPIIADVDSALLQLNALITRGKWQQSMALLADIEQRFPEVTQPQSKRYSQYTELKQRLSTR
jgi:arginine/lysine/ornithine decarboxylase